MTGPMQCPGNGNYPHLRGVNIRSMAAMMTKFDYPRTRGVYEAVVRAWATAFGSFPHTQGLHQILKH